MDLMEKKELKNNDNRIWFGQLYGMRNIIIFNLAPTDTMLQIFTIWPR
jgi:proline dehydrogenase